MATYDATRNLMMCEACQGTGEIGPSLAESEPCEKCQGSGWVTGEAEGVDFGLLFLAEKAAIVAQMAEASGFEFIGPAPVYSGA